MSGLVPIADAVAYTVSAQYGTAPCAKTLWWWCMKGVDGVYLKCVSGKGNALYTTAQWVREFEAARAVAARQRLAYHVPAGCSERQEAAAELQRLRDLGYGA